MKVLDSLRSRLGHLTMLSGMDQAPLDPRLAHALEQMVAHRFGPAQRALEDLVRLGRDAAAAEYLEDLRALRHCLRQVERRPREAGLRLELK